MKKPISIVFKCVLFLSFNIRTSQCMEIPTDHDQTRTKADHLLEMPERFSIENPYCMRSELSTTINNLAETPENRAHAQFKLADMDWLGLGIQKANHTAARDGFNAVLNNKDARPEDKESAQLKLVEIESFTERNEWARQKKLLVLKKQEMSKSSTRELTESTPLRTTSEPSDKDCSCIVF